MIVRLLIWFYTCNTFLDKKYYYYYIINANFNLITNIKTSLVVGNPKLVEEIDTRDLNLSNLMIVGSMN